MKDAAMVVLTLGIGVLGACNTRTAIGGLGGEAGLGSGGASSAKTGGRGGTGTGGFGTTGSGGVGGTGGVQPGGTGGVQPGGTGGVQPGGTGGVQPGGTGGVQPGGTGGVQPGGTGGTGTGGAGVSCSGVMMGSLAGSSGSSTGGAGGAGGQARRPISFRTAGDYTSASAPGTRAFPTSVRIADLSGDGNPDLVVAVAVQMLPAPTAGTGGAGPPSGAVSVYTNDGLGAFPFPGTFATGSAPQDLALGDLDGDGRSDVAVVTDAGVTILVNHRNGALGAPATYAAGTGSHALALGDLNLDGKTDLAVANFGNFTTNMAGDVGVLLNTGNGTFAAANYPTGASPVLLALGDLNDDGKPDLAVTNGEVGGGVGILRNSGAGIFAAPTKYGAGTGSTAIAVGDLNGDARPDIVLTNGNLNGGLSVLLNSGATGTFATGPRIYAAGTQPGALELGDLNGDGRADLVVVYNECAMVAVLVNIGDGTFGSPVGYPVGFGPGGVALGDLNGDGKTDLIASNDSGFRVFLNTTP